MPGKAHIKKMYLIQINILKTCPFVHKGFVFNVAFSFSSLFLFQLSFIIMYSVLTQVP